MGETARSPIDALPPSAYLPAERYSSLTGQAELPCHRISLGCVTGDAGKAPPFPFDGGPAGDDLEDPHARAGREWHGGNDPGTGGTKPMDVMWRFMQRAVDVPY